MDIKEFCSNTYNGIFWESYAGIKRGAEETRRKKAQKLAIKKTLVLALREFPRVEPAKIWRAIKVAHVHKMSDIDDLELIEKVDKAVNSWKSSSGKAFEELLQQLANPELMKHGLELLMPKDVSELIKKEKLLNHDRDKKSLREWKKSQTFDLYLAMISDAGAVIFGCVQAKTSIRDRVTRDREPSIKAMSRNFVSIAFVLDPEELIRPKYLGMATGGTEEFETNGWHAFYAFCDDRALERDRIHLVDLRMKKFVEHAVKGAEKFKNERQWLDASWNPEG